MKTPLTSSVAALIAFTLTAFGANIPLQQATVNRIINDVKVVDPKSGPRCANINDVIKDDIGVKTGLKSRCELLFQDNTLTRLGAETFFSFKPGTREMSLTEGTILLQVPKDQGGATIRTASVTASITGTTVMVEHRPNKSIKFLVLEGSMRIGNGRLGENVSLTPGKMLIISPTEKRMPDPVNVDLKKLIKTSSLVNPSGFSGGADGKKTKSAVLPSMPLINQSIKAQDVMRSKGMLQDTNLAILGKGTTVVVADDSMMAKLDSVSMDDKMMGKMDSQSMAMAMSPGASGMHSAPAVEVAPVVVAVNVPPVETVRTAPVVEAEVPLIVDNGRGFGDINTLGGGVGIDNGGQDTGNGEPDGGPAEIGAPGGSKTESIIVPPDLKLGLPNAVLTAAATESLPNWTALASATAGPTLNTPPVAIGAISLNGDSTFAGGAVPTIESGATNWVGSTYAGPANDGSAALFILGNVTDFEAQVGFDNLAGYGNGTIFPEEGMSVFKAASVSLGGSIRPDIGDIAIVAENNISTHADGLSLNLSDLRSATLATTVGKVVIGANADISATGTDFEFLQIHSRGGTKSSPDDSVEINGSISLPNAALIITAREDASFRLGSNVNVKDAYITAGDQVEVFGTVVANRSVFNARETVEIGGDLSVESLTINAKNFELRRGGVSVGDAVLNLTGNFYPGGLASVTSNSQSQNSNENPVFSFRNLAINAAGDVSLNMSSSDRARLDFGKAEKFSVTNASRVFISGGQFNVPESVNAVLDVVSVNSKTSETTVTGFDLIKTSANLNSHNLKAGDLQIGGNIVSSGLVEATNATVGGSIYGESFKFTNATVGGNLAASTKLDADTLTVGNDLVGKDMTIKTATVGGVVNSSGDVAVRDLAVGGNFVANNLSGQKAVVNGSASVRQDLSIGELKVRGSLAVNGAIRPGSLNSPSATTTLMAGSFKAGAGLQFKGAEAHSGGAGGLLDVFVPDVTTVATPGFSFSSATVNGANFDGGDATSNGGSGGDGGKLQIGTPDKFFAGMVTVDEKVTATTGKNGDGVNFGGTGGTFAVAATGKVSVKKDITVSQSDGAAKSRSGGNILIESAKTAGTAIEITSSAQLNALLAATAPGPGGKIQFKSAGGLIVANGGKFTADRGTVGFENTGENGIVTLNNVQVSADTVKVSALGANGTLNIGGGSLSANALLRLYAAGSNGTIRFTDSTKLDGNGLKIIAANTVTIANGKTVTVGGILPAGVFANQANFTGSGGNGSTSGKFDGRGAVRMPFGNAPSY